jgi:hypothetical protein
LRASDFSSVCERGIALVDAWPAFFPKERQAVTASIRHGLHLGEALRVRAALIVG